MTERALLAKRDALSRIVEIARDRFPSDVVEAAAVAGAKVDERLRHGTAHTVVALAGPTGSGKSSLFNALIGDDVSATSVRRPTTGRTHAAVFGSDDASALLDWLEVGRRHLVTTPNDQLDGLVLLDLPDHDSTEVDHQIEVDRLVALVDVLVWVTEPQKYADHVMHDRYLRPLSSYGDVMVFVISKTDLLSAADRSVVAEDFAARLRDDGVADPRVVTLSTVVDDDDGLVMFRSLLVDQVAQRRATVARLEADLAQAAGWFVSAGADRAAVPADVTALANAELAVAAGADRAADAVDRQHQRNGVVATGWPPTRWVRRLRKQPLAAMPQTSGNAGALARVDVALRNATEATGADLGAPWPAALRQAVDVERDALVAELGRATIDEARSTLTRPRWWSVGAWWQRVVGLAAAAGAAWLIALAVLGGLLRLDTDPLAIVVPGADWLPIPTLLLIGGAICGLLGAAVSAMFNRIGGRRRANTVRRSIGAAIESVTDQRVVEPMNRVLAERNELLALISTAQSISMAQSNLEPSMRSGDGDR